MQNIYIAAYLFRRKRMGTLFYGGTIYTMKQEGEMIEAVYTEGQLIVDYGDKHKLEKKYIRKINNK